MPLRRRDPFDHVELKRLPSRGWPRRKACLWCGRAMQADGPETRYHANCRRVVATVDSTRGATIPVGSHRLPGAS